MKDLILLSSAIRTHGWRAILLRPQSKRPLSRQAHWQVTTEIQVIEDHVRTGGNVGLIGHHLTIVDFDVPEAMTEMFEELGPLPITVRTGSGKYHSYLVGDESLPAKIRWPSLGGTIVGEIQRHPGQYVVCPPSVHPDTGERYVWASDPREELSSLPSAWREHLTRDQGNQGAVPAHVTEGDTRGQPADAPWQGPSPDELIRRALRQPNAVRRVAGVKFQCPQCREEGHDKHQDNALVRNDGRWGCAFAPNDPKHLQAIGQAVGTIQEPELEKDIYEYDEILRKVDVDKNKKDDSDNSEGTRQLRSIDLNKMKPKEDID